jgi:hypothetical protein
MRLGSDRAPLQSLGLRARYIHEFSSSGSSCNVKPLGCISESRSVQQYGLPRVMLSMLRSSAKVSQGVTLAISRDSESVAHELTIVARSGVNLDSLAATRSGLCSKESVALLDKSQSDLVVQPDPSRLLQGLEMTGGCTSSVHFPHEIEDTDTDNISLRIYPAMRI